MTDLLMLTRLEEALARDGCPVCQEVERATRQYLKQFLREGKAGGRGCPPRRRPV